ncbi:voltage-dependent anion channel [Pilobolus umbonatus]|nr:voltage-dependent anion channel [Pilobolus umbonatus]
MKKSFPRTARKIVRNFTPSWFSVNMGTGVLSMLLYNFPYPFHGLHTIATVLFVFNVVIYCLFTLITVARYTLWPEIFVLMMKHPAQSLFIGTMPMGLTTIGNFIVLALTDKYAWAMDLAFGIWIAVLVLTAFSCIMVPYYIIVHHDHEFEKMNGTWLLPIVPAVVAAASGGLLANKIDEERAIVILVVSYILMGLGLLLALSIIVIYFFRLAVHSLPPKEVIISSFLPLGPLGQGAYGLLQLGSASYRLLGDDYIVGLGHTAYGMGFITALILWGYGLWYLVVAIFSVGITVKNKIPFNMGWWGLTFPLGVFASATLSIGQILGWPFFLVLASILICCLVVIWIAVVTKTLLGAFSGDIFYAPCLTPALQDDSSRR